MRSWKSRNIIISYNVQEYEMNTRSKVVTFKKYNNFVHNYIKIPGMTTSIECCQAEILLFMHSFTPALLILDTSGEKSTPFFIANLLLHSLAPFHPPLSLTHSAHFSQTKFHPFASHYSLFQPHNPPT